MASQVQSSVAEQSSTIRAMLTPLQLAMYLLIISGGPLLGLAALWGATESEFGRLLLTGFAPALYAAGYALLAGLLSVPHHWAIQPGRFPRDTGTRLYAGRRLYGACFTSLYYFKPVYHAVLTFRPMKWVVFRLFGYRGSMNFTVYPDTWIRDLPLLDLGEGAYISNRATLGTNMCLHDGRILVDNVRIGSKALVGHLTMVAPGAVIGDRAEIGVGAAVGLKVRVGNGANVSGPTALHHASVIGDGASVGVWSYIAPRVRVAPGDHLPSCSFIMPFENHPDSDGRTAAATDRPGERDLAKT